jgi:crotonobetainyl-CoA:carnitine CoA-transferase CaiB-like acyl-CoA transferase
MPERGRTWSVYDLVNTADGQQVFIGVTSDRHWKRMCETFGFSDWLENESLATNQDRCDAREWFLPELMKRLGALNKTELMRLAEKADIPFSLVNRPEDLFEDPHLNQSGGLAETVTPDGKKKKLPKIPLRLNGATFDLRSQPPAVGEGSLAIYREIGLTDQEIKDLNNEEIIKVDEPDQ